VKLQTPKPKLQKSGSRQRVNGKAGRSLPLYTTDATPVGQLNEDPPASGPAKHRFDLEERTARFGEAILRFSKKVPRSPANDRLIGQLVGAGTSVGANYCEASERVSQRDFHNIVGRCAKEAKETRFFLRMIATSEPKLAAEGRNLYREARELHLIFASIYRG